VSQEANNFPPSTPQTRAVSSREQVQGQKRPKRTPKDPLFKELVSLYFSAQSLSEFSINPGLQVGQTQLEIDVAVRAAETLSLTQIGERLKDTPFPFFAYLNLLEFKSVNDKLDLADFYRTAARALFAAATYYESLTKQQGKAKKAGRPAKKQPQPARVVSCLVCATYPQSVQDQLHTPFQPLAGQPEGFYFRPYSETLFLPGYLIVCSELPLQEKYYSLLVFAAGNKLRDFIEMVIDQELEVYVKYVAKLHANEVAEAFERRKRGGILTTGEERLARTLIDILGEDKVVEIVGTRRLATALAGWDLEQRLSLLQTLMPGLSEQELRTLLERSALRAQKEEEKPEK
jgi:hypothetical protein